MLHVLARFRDLGHFHLLQKLFAAGEHTLKFFAIGGWGEQAGKNMCVVRCLGNQLYGALILHAERITVNCNSTAYILMGEKYIICLAHYKGHHKCRFVTSM